MGHRGEGGEEVTRIVREWTMAFFGFRVRISRSVRLDTETRSMYCTHVILSTVTWSKSQLKAVMRESKPVVGVVFELGEVMVCVRDVATSRCFPSIVMSCFTRGLSCL